MNNPEQMINTFVNISFALSKMPSFRYILPIVEDTYETVLASLICSFWSNECASFNTSLASCILLKVIYSEATFAWDKTVDWWARVSCLIRSPSWTYYNAITVSPFWWCIIPKLLITTPTARWISPCIILYFKRFEYKFLRFFIST